MVSIRDDWSRDWTLEMYKHMKEGRSGCPQINLIVFTRFKTANSLVFGSWSPWSARPNGLESNMARFLFKKDILLGVVVHDFNPSTWEAVYRASSRSAKAT